MILNLIESENNKSADIRIWFIQVIIIVVVTETTATITEDMEERGYITAIAIEATTIVIAIITGIFQKINLSSHHYVSTQYLLK